jgi:hypothetical protein
MASMNILTKEKRIRVLRALVEGNSIRTTVRITGVAKNTVVKLLRDAGRACEDEMADTIVTVRRFVISQGKLNTCLKHLYKTFVRHPSSLRFAEIGKNKS